MLRLSSFEKVPIGIDARARWHQIAAAREAWTGNSPFPPAKQTIMIERVDAAIAHVRILFDVPIAIEEYPIELSELRFLLFEEERQLDHS